ncbi:MAG: sortase [Anaerolineaceae bacterium]
MNKIFRMFLILSILVTSLLLSPIQKVQADISFPAQINQQFLPASIPAGGVSTLSITIYNPNSFPLTLFTSPAAFTETLPAGITIADPVTTTTSCGGIVTTSGTTFSLVGGSVPAQTGTTPGNCTFTINISSIVAGSLYNVINGSVLHASNPDGSLPITNATSSTVTLSVTSLQPPSLSKSFSSNTMWVGINNTLTIRITNTDLNYPLTKTSVIDTLPTNFTLNSTVFTSSNCGSPTVTKTDGSPLSIGTTAIKISNATIPLNSSCSVNLTVTSTVPGVYLNTIPAQSIQTQQGVTNSSAAAAPVNVQNIGITKSFAPNNVQAGGFSTLTVTLSNPAPQDYTGVKFTDTLPSGMTIFQPAVFSTTCTTGGNPAVVSTDGSNSALIFENGTIPHAVNGTAGSCYVKARVTVSTAGTYTNSIPVGYLTTGLTGVTNVAAATANLSVYGQGAGLTVTKQFSPATIPVGGTSTLSISITSPADVDLHNFSITDALPAGVNVASTPGAVKGANCIGGTFAPAANDTLLTYTGGEIDATKVCTLSVKVVAAGKGTYTNVISPSNISNTENRNISGNISATLTVSGISVDKAYYPTTVNVNGISTITITLTNENVEQLDNVQFNDPLPAGLIVSPSPHVLSTCGSGITADPNTTSISLSGGTIPAKVGSVNGICTVNVDVKALTTGTKRNTIAASAVQGVLHTSGVLITNPSGVSRDLEVHDLVIEVNKFFSPIEVHGGSTSTLSVYLHNPNNYPLVGIGFTDNLPQDTPTAGMRIAPAPHTSVGTCGGSISALPGATSFTFSGGYLNNNQSCTLTVDVTMNVNNTRENTIIAGGVTSTNGGSNIQPATATLVNLPGASVTKAFSDVNGLNATLTITIQNLSNFLIDGVDLTDNFPSTISVVSASSGQCNGAVSSTLHSVTLDNGSLDDKTSCNVVVQVQASTAGSFTNCIPGNSLFSNQGATNIEQACDTLTVSNPLSPPQITKTFAPTTIALGSSSVVSFKITNPNATALTGVSFTDEFPANMTLPSIPNVSQCGGTVSSTANSITFTGGTIAASGSCTIQAGVTTSVEGAFVNNTSNISSTNGGTGNASSATLTVLAPPILTKSFDAANIFANQISTLHFYVTNPASNTLALTGIGFVDPLPTGVKVAASPNSSFTNQCGVATFTPQSGDTDITFSAATIAPGTTCIVNVDVTAINGGVYNNTTEKVTSSNGGSGNTASDTLTVSGPGLTLLKTTSAIDFQKTGDTISYNYLLTNSGNTSLYPPFLVSDDHISGSVDCTNSLSVLNPSQSTSCTASYIIRDVDVTSKSVTNIASATALDAPGGVTVTSNQSSVTVDEAQLTIDKRTSTVSYLSAGNKINYSYTLTNTGKVTLYAPFTVSDDHIGVVLGTPFTCGTATSLAPGANTTCTSIYTVIAGDVTAGVVTNSATASGFDAPSGGTEVKSALDSVTVNRITSPTISKVFSPDVMAIGQTSTLTFTILNPNSVPLTGVAFSDVLPLGMSVTITPDAAQCGGSVAWNSTTRTLSLTNGSIIGSSCTVTAVVTANAAKDYVNTTGIVSTTNGGNGNTATDTLRVVQGAVISKSFNPGSIFQGGVSTLTILVTNPASNTDILSGISFTDAFPAGVAVAPTPNISISNCGVGAGFNPSAGATSLTFTNGTLAIGDTCTLQVDVTAPAAGVYENTTSAITSTNGGSGSPSNTAVLTANQVVDLSVTKTDGVLDVNPGENLVYTMVVHNAGPSNAVGAKVSDTFPATLTSVTWTCSSVDAGALCTSTGSGNINDTVNLPAGASLTYTVTATVLSSNATSVVNNVSVLPPTGLSDSDPTNNSASDIDALNSLTITKTPDHATYSIIGSQIVYTYTVRNIGTSTLKKPFAVVDDKLTPVCNSLPETLAPNGSFVCTGTHTITGSDLDAGSIVNSAYATATDNDGNSIKSNTPVVTVTAVQTPLIGLAKQLTSSEKVSTGTYDVTYTFTVKNYGNVTISNLQITDNLNTTFPAPTTYSVRSITSPDLLVNTAFNGNSNQNLLLSGNSLAAGESRTLLVSVRLIPTSHGIFYNSASISGKSPTNSNVVDVSQNGSNPDPDVDGDPTNNNEPTPVDFGAHIFDPPFGIKTLDDRQMPLMTWNMIWINDTNIVPVFNTVHDPIPEDTEYVPDFTDSGFTVPSGAPAGSTSAGVTCTASGNSITTLCYYEGPTPDNPRGQIIWTGMISPDFGITDPALASNPVKITFSVRYLNHKASVANTATIDTDLNGDGDTADFGEQKTADAAATWYQKPTVLPSTGFAPGLITQLPDQPKELVYSDMGLMWIEIPSLTMQSTIIGVPEANNGWNIAWIGKNTGWLNGTAYPTHAGNSVLTGHVFDANGLPGPFANIDKLKYGDKIIIHAWGQEFTYEVRDSKLILPSDSKSVLKHEDLSWITLLTCKGFDENTGTYTYRYLVKAVLIKVK